MRVFELRDAWAFDLYRKNRFVAGARLLCWKDVVVEELPKEELP